MEEIIYSKPINTYDDLLSRTTTGILLKKDEGDIQEIEYFDGLKWGPLEVAPFNAKTYQEEGFSAGWKDAMMEAPKGSTSNPYKTPKKYEYWEIGYNQGYDQYVPAGRFIDLGLPSGVLWCEYNLGVDPSDVDTKEKWEGNCYSWGEVETKSFYDLIHYKFYNTDTEKITKYRTSNAILEDSDNVVKQNIGDSYDMPTKSDIDELLQYTEYVYVTNYNGINGLHGYKFVSKVNGNHIFFETEDPGVVPKAPSDKTVLSFDAIWTKQVADLTYYSEHFYAYYLSIVGGDYTYVSCEPGYRSAGLKIRPIKRSNTV